MEKIDTLYTVLTEENGRETIAALRNNGLVLQAVASNEILIKMAYQKLKELEPTKAFYIKEFVSK